MKIGCGISGFLFVPAGARDATVWTAAICEDKAACADWVLLAAPCALKLAPP